MLFLLPALAAAISIASSQTGGQEILLKQYGSRVQGAVTVYMAVYGCAGDGDSTAHIRAVTNNGYTVLATYGRTATYAIYEPSKSTPYEAWSVALPIPQQGCSWIKTVALVPTSCTNISGASFYVNDKSATSVHSVVCSSPITPTGLWTNVWVHIPENNTSPIKAIGVAGIWLYYDPQDALSDQTMCAHPTNTVWLDPCEYPLRGSALWVNTSCKGGNYISTSDDWEGYPALNANACATQEEQQLQPDPSSTPTPTPQPSPVTPANIGDDSQKTLLSEPTTLIVTISSGVVLSICVVTIMLIGIVWRVDRLVRRRRPEVVVTPAPRVIALRRSTPVLPRPGTQEFENVDFMQTAHNTVQHVSMSMDDTASLGVYGSSSHIGQFEQVAEIDIPSIVDAQFDHDTMLEMESI